MSAVCFQWIDGGCQGSEVEGLALCLGMRMAETMGANEMIFVSDSLNVINAALMGSGRRGFRGAWLDVCLRMRRSKPGWLFKHALREDNVIADRTAKYAFESQTSWLNPWAIPLCFNKLRC